MQACITIRHCANDLVIFNKRVIPYEINQEKAKMFLTPSDFDKIWHTCWGYYEFMIHQILDLKVN